MLLGAKDGGFDLQGAFECRAGAGQIALGAEHAPQFMKKIASPFIGFCRSEGPDLASQSVSVKGPPVGASSARPT